MAFAMGCHGKQWVSMARPMGCHGKPRGFAIGHGAATACAMIAPTAVPMARAMATLTP